MSSSDTPTTSKSAQTGRWWNRWFSPQPGTMLSPGADFLMAGGASLIFYAFLIPVGSTWVEVAYWGAAMYFAAFLINYPHFAASYQLLYQDLRSYFFAPTEHRWFSLRLWWAGMVVPLLLVGYFLVFLYLDSPTALGYLVNLMLFTVGWHYVKQVFGCTIVLSAARQIYYSTWERYALLVPLYLLWLYQYARVNTGTETLIYFGIPYTPLGVPSLLTTLLGIGLSAGLIAMLVVLGRKFYTRGHLAPIAAIAAYLSVFVWFHPAISSFYYLAIVPLFHSLQYLLFVAAYKKNQALTSQTTPPVPEHGARQITTLVTTLFIAIPVGVIVLVVNQGFTGRMETALQNYVASFTGSPAELLLPLTTAAAIVFAILLGLELLKRYAAVAFVFTFVLQTLILGALLFGILPAILDTMVLYDLLPAFLNYNVEVYGATLYLFFFTVFVNIHHFFIDNVIWRRDNPKVREFLYAHPSEQFELDGKMP